MTQRILFVVDAPYDFGSIQQLNVLIRGLDTSRNEIHLAIMTELAPSGLFAENSEHHLVLPNSTAPQKFVRLRNLIKHLQPEIVHAWNNSSHSQVKNATSFTKSCRRVFTFLEQPESRGLFRSWSDKFQMRGSDAFIVSHQTLADGLREQGLQELTVIPNTISDHDSDRPAARRRLLELAGLESESTGYVYLAGATPSFRPRFRVKDIVWAMDLLCCIRKDIHLLIFGDGDDAAIRRFISFTEAGDNIHLVPRDLWSECDLAGLDIFWNAHLQTPNPTSLLTAMANEIPVISVHGLETSDLIKPLATGLAANFGARDELPRWTKFLIEQPDSRAQLVAQAKKFAEENFPAKAAVSAYEILYG